MYARDHAVIATPIGAVRVMGDDRHATAVSLCLDEPPTPASDAPVRAAAEQLEQWFAGDRTRFDLPLEPAATARGATLRAGLIAVGYGETLSYGALARLLGSAPRAIGQLCARNPLPILVPCHRIIGSGGTLGHYSGGHGTRTKTALLDHERRHAKGTLV